MLNRKLIAAVSVVVALVPASSPLRASEPIGNENRLTFKNPVALPGVRLAMGTYLFELLPSSTNIVRVSSGDRQRVYYMGFTRVIERSRAIDSSSVTFGEAPAGAAIPITAWYPPGSLTGQQFIYR